VEKECTGLLAIMEKQLEIYRRLLTLAYEKRPVLVKGKIPELEKITKEEELLILQVGRLEEQRQVLVRALANHFVLSPEDVTLSRITERVDEETCSKLQQVLEDLPGVLKELADINEVNTELIKNSLDYINFSIDILVSNSRTPVYNQHEEKKKESAAKIFDRKV